MKPADRNVTLNDVAAHAGVSYQTVSRVINEHPNVAENTRTRVLKSIRELGYRPNLAARSLVTNRSNTIAIISFGTTFYGPSRMVANITQQARKNGYHATLRTVEKLEQAEIKQALDDVHAQLIDGIIMIAPVISESLAEVTHLVGDIPVVQVDTGHQQTVPSVVIDQAYGSQLITEHLINLGHRNIVEISGPLNWHDAILRHQSWIQTMEAHDLPSNLSIEGHWTARSGHEAMQDLLKSAADFTAVVVANDQMALGAIAALNEAGLRVPGDISVVGFDDIPEAAYFLPSLTTVRQNFLAVGEQSVDYLMSLIKNPAMPVHQRVLQPELVIRNSTASLNT